MPALPAPLRCAYRTSISELLDEDRPTRGILHVELVVPTRRLFLILNPIDLADPLLGWEPLELDPGDHNDGALGWSLQAKQSLAPIDELHRVGVALEADSNFAGLVLHAYATERIVRENFRRTLLNSHVKAVVACHLLRKHRERHGHEADQGQNDLVHFAVSWFVLW